MKPFLSTENECRVPKGSLPEGAVTRRVTEGVKEDLFLYTWKFHNAANRGRSTHGIKL